MPGFCKSRKAAYGYVLPPRRYVGASEIEADDEAFEEKMLPWTAKLEKQFAESAKLEAEIRQNLKGLGYEF